MSLPEATHTPDLDAELSELRKRYRGEREAVRATAAKIAAIEGELAAARFVAKAEAKAPKRKGSK